MSNKKSPPARGLPPKAYKNLRFMNSSGARTIRMLAEYQEPLRRLDRHGIKETIVFFGSARLLGTEAAAKKLVEARSAEERSAAKRLCDMAHYYEEARELARLLTAWSCRISDHGQRFVICSGGGPGIMEAANRGAHEAGGPSVGFNISLPTEQMPNPYITPDLCFQFHYFFMRKLWFAYLARALVVFPGGFGTLDEMAEILTLIQTDKTRKPMKVILYGTDYWNGVVNFDAMVDAGTISASDLKLFERADSPRQAFRSLSRWLERTYLAKRRRIPARGRIH